MKKAKLGVGVGARGADAGVKVMNGRDSSVNPRAIVVIANAGGFCLRVLGPHQYAWGRVYLYLISARGWYYDRPTPFPVCRKEYCTWVRNIRRCGRRLSTHRS